MCGWDACLIRTPYVIIKNLLHRKAQQFSIQLSTRNTKALFPASNRRTRFPATRPGRAEFPTLAEHLAPPHRTLRLASILLFAQGLALIPLLLAASKRDLDLGVRAKKVDR